MDSDKSGGSGEYTDSVHLGESELPDPKFLKGAINFGESGRSDVYGNLGDWDNSDGFGGSGESVGPSW